MYSDYFGLKEAPFSIAPDPHYFFISEGHREALAHLMYGIQSDGGFVLLTGEVGTGKTTVCRCLLEQIPENYTIAFILNPKLSAVELLSSICDEFGIVYPRSDQSVKDLIAKIYDFLFDTHERGGKAVLIIEEAQNLSVEVLEQVRLLTNLETNRRKLLQIIMVGQPELRKVLSKPELRQLSQRITARYHLGPLSRTDTAAYVQHRLSVAGLVRGEIFSPSILNLLYRLTGGTPRLINVICDRSLLGAFVQGKNAVDRETLLTAKAEVTGAKRGRFKKSKPAWIFVILLATAVLLAGAAYYTQAVFPLYTPTLNKTAGKLYPVEKAPADTVLTPGTKPGTAFASSRDLAYGALFEKWQMKYNSKDSRAVCEQAQAGGLRCQEGKDTLEVLRRMNKPAVLRLVDPNGRDYYATLVSLQGETATYAVGGETKSGDIREMIKSWSGDYLLLWHFPAEYKDTLKPGGAGVIVAWLENQLARLQGREPQIGNKRVYEGKMVRDVKEFQSASGLKTDGIVGPITIERLIVQTGGDGPQLNGSVRGN
jgi:general secretion pathway protein A